jgi:hypothetical protein
MIISVFSSYFKFWFYLLISFIILKHFRGKYPSEIILKSRRGFSLQQEETNHKNTE